MSDPIHLVFDRADLIANVLPSTDVIEWRQGNDWSLYRVGWSRRRDNRLELVIYTDETADA